MLGKYIERNATKVQNIMLKIALKNKVKYEKLYKFRIICEKPTYAVADAPKKIHI